MIKVIIDILKHAVCVLVSLLIIVPLVNYVETEHIYFLLIGYIWGFYSMFGVSRKKVHNCDGPLGCENTQYNESMKDCAECIDNHNNMEYK